MATAIAATKYSAHLLHSHVLELAADMQVLSADLHSEAQRTADEVFRLDVLIRVSHDAAANALLIAHVPPCVCVSKKSCQASRSAARPLRDSCKSIYSPRNVSSITSTVNLLR